VKPNAVPADESLKRSQFTVWLPEKRVSAFYFVLVLSRFDS
jgi:hypothetical protein